MVSDAGTGYFAGQPGTEFFIVFQIFNRVSSCLKRVIIQKPESMGELIFRLFPGCTGTNALFDWNNFLRPGFIAFDVKHE